MVRRVHLDTGQTDAVVVVRIVRVGVRGRAGRTISHIESRVLEHSASCAASIKDVMATVRQMSLAMLLGVVVLACMRADVSRRGCFNILHVDRRITL